jgi:glycosyltransferase involved in cell wall biosynthesis
MISKLPISVQICTLNEENNIEDCLNYVLLNNPEEIIVIDGDSEDKTVEIATSYGVKVIKAGRIGLAKQRQLGIESTNLRYIAIVDADDRLDKNCLPTLFSEIKIGNYKAIQANVQSFLNRTYWQTAWGLYCSVNINDHGLTNIVGRPAIFETSSLRNVGFDAFFTYGSEDTDISYRFEKLSLRQGIGTGISYRIHPSTFYECRNKWISYGRGYSRFIFKHRERTFGILYHLFWNIPLRRNFKTIKKRGFKYIPFFFLYSIYCQIGLIKEIINLQLKMHKNDFGR